MFKEDMTTHITLVLRSRPYGVFIPIHLHGVVRRVFKLLQSVRVMSVQNAAFFQCFLWFLYEQRKSSVEKECHCNSYTASLTIPYATRHGTLPLCIHLILKLIQKEL